MVLELCAYGSLSDILRGSDNNSGGRLPLSLTLIDKMFLALGCARLFIIIIIIIIEIFTT